MHTWRLLVYVRTQVAAAMAAWTWPTIVAMIADLLIACNAIAQPLRGTLPPASALYLLPAPVMGVIGACFLALVALALRWPLRGGLGASLVIYTMLIALSLHPFNWVNTVLWLLLAGFAVKEYERATRLQGWYHWARARYDGGARDDRDC